MSNELWGKKQGSSIKLLDILAYMPPVVFIIFSYIVSFQVGIIVALVFSIVLAAIRSREGNLGFNAIYPVFFSVCIIVLYAFPEQAEILMNYRGALVWGAFSAMAFGSLLLRYPFTLQHAKKQVIDGVLDSPVFISVNYVLTSIFAFVFLVDMMINALWDEIVAVNLVSFGLVIVAVILTIVLPARYVPWYLKKYGAKAIPKDLGKLPLSMIFQGMISRFDSEKAKDWDTVIQYIVTGKDGGTYYLEIKNQRCKLIEGKADNPDLTITANKEDWVAISEGKLEGQKAFMEGKMKAKGNMNDLLRMQEVFLTGGTLS